MSGDDRSRSAPERDLAAEFRALAEAVLDRVDPVLRRLDDRGGAIADGPEWQGCSWCPLCAFAALLRGERHDLLTLMSGELDVVVRTVRDLLRDHGDRHPPASGDDTAPGPGPHPAPPQPASDRPVYRPITVTVKDDS